MTLPGDKRRTQKFSAERSAASARSRHNVSCHVCECLSVCVDHENFPARGWREREKGGGGGGEGVRKGDRERGSERAEEGESGRAGERERGRERGSTPQRRGGQGSPQDRLLQSQETKS